MKKFFTGFFVAVMALTVSANAEVSEFVASDVQKTTVANEQTFNVKAKKFSTTSKASRVATCNNLSNGNTVCTDTYTDGVRWTATYLASGALYSERYDLDAYNIFTFYYNSSAAVANPSVTKVSLVQKYSNNVVGFSQTRVLNTNAYTYQTAEYIGLGYYPKFSSLSQLKYSSAGKKTSYIRQNKNTRGVITKHDERNYYATGKTSKSYFEYRNAANKITKQDARSYFTNGKMSNRVVYNRNSKGVKTAAYRMLYRSNGKKKVYRKLYFKKGKETKMLEYVYNRKGQKKSNKYGNAYRVTYTINSKKKVTKIIKAKYNKKGKLGKGKRATTKGKVVYF